MKLAHPTHMKCLLILLAVFACSHVQAYPGQPMRGQIHHWKHLGKKGPGKVDPRLQGIANAFILEADQIRTLAPAGLTMEAMAPLLQDWAQATYGTCRVKVRKGVLETVILLPDRTIIAFNCTRQDISSGH